MSELLPLLSALVELVREEPQLVQAVAHVFSLIQTGQDPTPAMKRAQALAEARALGLNPSRV